MRISLLLLFSLLSTATLAAQSVTPTVVGSAGGSGQVGEMTVMWTVGEVAVTTLRGGDMSLTQGFHQPPPGTTDAPLEVEGPLALSAHPNPVVDYLNVSLPEGSRGGSFTLVDLLGRTVLEQASAGGATAMTVDISTLPSGIYVARYTAGESTYGTTITVQR